MAGKLKIVYHVQKQEGRDKPFWNRIGVCFVNKDGSLSLKLEYLPIAQYNRDGALTSGLDMVIRDYEPKEKSDSDSFSE